MLRFCSTMGTLLLALSLTTPALADKKKKKSSSSDDAPAASSSESSSSGGGDIDSMMSNSVKGKDKRDSSGQPAAEEKKEEPPPDDSWERPPVEEEKPKGPPPKAAEKPAGDGKHISAGLLLGWAFKTDRKNGMGASDPYELGFGIRGGYSFDFHLYAGVFFMYYIGSSNSQSSLGTTVGSASSKANYMQFGAEAGYDLWAGPVIIRPSLQIGPAILLVSGNGLAVPNGSYTRMMLGPGVTVVYPIDSFFIGGDGRFNVVTSSNGVSSFLLAVHGGLRFE